VSPELHNVLMGDEPTIFVRNNYGALFAKGAICHIVIVGIDFSTLC
jgi:hypothetical protein